MLMYINDQAALQAVTVVESLTRKMIECLFFHTFPTLDFLNTDSDQKFCYHLKLSSHPDWCSSVDWVWAANQRVTGLIPSQGTRLGCRPGPQLGVCERQPHIDVFLPLFLPPFPSFQKINK